MNLLLFVFLLLYQFDGKWNRIKESINNNILLILNLKRESLNVRKRTFEHVLPAKIHISMRIRAVWSESSLGAYWPVKDAKFLRADSGYSDQTVRTRRLTLVVFGRICQRVRFLDVVTLMFK